MKDKTPAGLTPEQWDAITVDLRKHPNTINDYRKVINVFQKWNKDKTILTITPEDARNYFDSIDARVNDQTMTLRTAHRYKATLRSIGARIQSNQTLFNGYVNPFSRLMKNEIRARTQYDQKHFVPYEDLKRFILAMDQICTPEEKLILLMMMNCGLKPATIQQLRVDAFRLQDGHLVAKLHMPSFLEHCKNGESSYDRSDARLRYVRKSRSGTITWNYTGLFVFDEEAEELLHTFYRNVGRSKDTRRFFLTSRHLEYNYRAVHHLVLEVNKQAGLAQNAISPYQLTLVGILRSWLSCTLMDTIQDSASSAEEKKEAEEKLNALNQHIHMGYWQDGLPIPHKIQIEEMLKNLSEEELYHIAQLQ